MKINYYIQGIFFLILILCSSIVSAQEIQECGAVKTEEYDNFLRENRETIEAYEQEFFQLKKTRSAGRNTNEKTSIPIHAIPIARTDGTGRLSDADIEIAINSMNSFFGDMNIEFFICSIAPTIEDDDLYIFRSKAETDAGDDDEDLLYDGGYIQENIVNIVFTNLQPLNGYAYYPGGKDLIVMRNSVSTNGTTISHEMGHFYGLQHTHNAADGSEGEDMIELVDGSNCAIAGDTFCDTPADPDISGLVNSDCEYTGTVQDPNGDFYAPDVTNLMSYGRRDCRNKFSLEQQARVYAVLKTSRGDFVCPDISIDASADVLSTCENSLTVNFTDNSTNATTWAWDFDTDGTVDSNDQNPSYTYSEGTFFPSLTISNGTQTISKTFYSIPISVGVQNTLPVDDNLNSYTSANDSGWQSVPASSGFKWLSNTGGTPSSGTGPLADADASGTYFYTEASASDGESYSSGDEATLLSPCTTLGEHSILTFQYHMYATDLPRMGSLHVDVTTDNGATYIEDVMDPIIGVQQENQSDAYKTARVDLSDYAGQVVKYRFRAVYASYQSDIAIDNIIIQDESEVKFEASTYSSDCQATATINFTDESYLLSGPVTSWAWDLDGDGTTDSTAQNPTYNFTEAGTFTVTLTASNSTESLSKTFTEKPIIIGAEKTAPYEEKFTDFTTGVEINENGWTTIPSSNGYTWLTNVGGTSSNNTGPTSDGDGSTTANYAYTEAGGSISYPEGDETSLISPCVKLGLNSKLLYKYHIFSTSSSFGSLHVDISIDNGVSYTEIISYEDPVTTLGDFIDEEIDLSAYDNQIVNIRFRAIKGNTSRNDIAVDNIIFKSGSEIHFSADTYSSNCQSTATINFTDESSLVSGPITAWAWDFDSDGTVDSTEENPSYEFTQEGTFNVTLTVSNSSESLSKTFTETPITIGGEKQIAYSQDFTDFTSDVEVNEDGWTTVPSPNGYTWLAHFGGTSSSGTGPVVDGDGSDTANYVYTEAGGSVSYPEGDETSLISPCIKLGINATLSFKYHIHSTTSNFGSLHVEISTDSGTTYTELIAYEEPIDPRGDFLDETIDLSAYDGQIVTIRFRAIKGDTSRNDIAVDNIVIDSETPAPTGNNFQSFCEGATIEDIEVVGTDIIWYDAAVNGNVLTPDTVLENETIYHASQTISEHESNERLSVAITLGTLRTPTGETEQSFCDVNATIADLEVNETDIVWYDAATEGNELPTNTQLVDGSIYYAAQNDGTCESESRLAVTVMVGGLMTPTGNETQSFCSAATIADLEVNETDIIWYDAATDGNELPTNTQLVDGNIYYAAQNDGTCESESRLAVTVTIGELLTPTGNETQSFCSAATIADLEVNETDIVWYDAATEGNELPTNTQLVDGNIYYAAQNDGTCESESRLAITVTIGELLTPTGNETQSFCSAATIADLEVNETDIVWYDAATDGNELPTNTQLVDGSIYYAAQNDGTCESENRLAITVTIGELLTPTGNETQSFCSEATIADLEVNETDIVWYDAATDGNELPTNTQLVDRSIYYAAQNDGTCESENRLAITVTIGELLTPTGNESQSFCSTATIADLEVNETDIVWYDTATDGNELPTNTQLVDGSIYYAAQNDGTCESESRLAITVMVGGLMTPTGNESQSFCSAATIADLEVNETDIVWYDAATDGNELPTNTQLVDGSIYYAAQNDGTCESESRLAITVTIGELLTPTGNEMQSFCSTATIADLEVNETDIVWYDAATDGNELPTNTQLVDGSTYYAAQNEGTCESESRLAITVTIGELLTPTGNETQSFCTAATIADLEVNETDIVWYDAATDGNELPTNTQLVDGSIYYAAQNDGTCESESRLAITVTIGELLTPTGNESQSFCSAATIADLEVNETDIVWYDAATDGNELPTNTQLVDGSIYYAAQNDGTCESESRLAVTVTIGKLLTPTGNESQSFCSAATIADLEVNETEIVWYDAATDGNELPTNTQLVDGSIYYAAQNDGTCESESRLAITVTIGELLTPTGNESQSFCSAATIADLEVNETDIVWYDAATDGNELPTNTQLVDGSIYYAAQNDGTCESESRLAVTVTIGELLTPTGNETQSFCSAATIADLEVNETDIVWYDAATDGNELPTNTQLVDGSIYYATQNDGTCESESRLAVSVMIGGSETTTINYSTNYFCADAENASPTISGIQNGSFTATPSGLVINSSTGVINIANSQAGNYTITYTPTGDCSTAADFQITIAETLDTSFTVTDTSITANMNNATYQWINCANGGNPIPGATNQTFIPEESGTYALQVTLNGCSQTSNCIEFTVEDGSSIGDLYDRILVYPNPTEGNLNIYLGEHTAPLLVNIYDESGRLVHSKSGIKSEIYSFIFNVARGTYIIDILENGDRVKSYRVIKK
ncbi:Ig-like domain-containing protein [Joostella sp. CR20]|uniref:Ig-like domain-containing protein n=1 Tax=Joostella sp. CR20 TaxID=2804312 RepID=UPI00313AF72F